MTINLELKKRNVDLNDNGWNSLMGEMKRSGEELQLAIGDTTCTLRMVKGKKKQNESVLSIIIDNVPSSELPSF